jgi:glycogen debranching enzyme
VIIKSVLMLGAGVMAAAQGSPLLNGPVRVGPFYPQTANGITWVFSDQAARHLAVGFVEKNQLLMEYPQLAGVWRPLAAATDSSYYAIEWKLAAATVRLRWAAQLDGSVAGVVESDCPVRLALVARPSWRDFAAVTYRGTAADGLAAAGAGSVPAWSVRALSPVLRQAAATNSEALVSALLSPATVAPASVEGTWAGQLFDVTPAAPLRFVAGAGAAAAPPEAAMIEARLAQAERQYEAATPKDPDLEAIQVAMNISRLYSPVLKTLAHTISRGWCKEDEIRLFCWDSFFNGILAVHIDPVTARDTIRGILATATPEGFIPNIGSDRSKGRPSNRSQPTVGAMAVWEMHEQAPDLAFLAEVYPKLVKWHEWWFAINPATGKPNRDGNGNGLLEWGCSNGQAQDVKFETGMDDSPMYDEMEVDPVSKNMRMDAVDLSALWAMDAECLGKIAEVLGRSADVQRFRGEVATMNRCLNELCWDEEAGFYANRYWAPRIESFRTPLVTVPASCWTTPAGNPGLQSEYFKSRKMDQVLATETLAVPELSNQQERDLLKLYGNVQKNLFLRWSGTLTAPQDGWYVLSVEGQGGSQFWLDGRLLLDQGRPLMPPNLRTQPFQMKAGEGHAVKVEYVAWDYQGLRVTWCRLPEPLPEPRSLSSRYAVTGLYPLISGAPDAARAQRILQAVRDECQFGGQYVLPTISRKDPAFPVQHYWRGKIWGPTNYLAWLGLQRYGDPALLAEVAEKCEALFMLNWREGRRYHENYLCDGTGSNDPHYTWGALLALIHYENRMAAANIKTRN